MLARVIIYTALVDSLTEGTEEYDAAEEKREAFDKLNDAIDDCAFLLEVANKPLGKHEYIVFNTNNPEWYRVVFDEAHSLRNPDFTPSNTEVSLCLVSE